MRKNYKTFSLICIASLLTSYNSSFANIPTTIKTDNGLVRGLKVEKGYEFRGIPFAKPPIGKLRWREASKLDAWKGVFDATKYGFACPQKVNNDKKPFAQSEDCLNLNIITPNLKTKNAKSKKLPVLVVIHGGAFAFGSNQQVTEQGVSPLIERGIVLVAPNYRVGRFGFFAHPALTKEASRGTGNFWLSDQIMALKWVKKNISNFGGDPNNVTIIGCSAGGSSVNALMAAPLARGLFARASARSGGGLFNANRPLAKAEGQGLDFAKRVNIAGDEANTLSHLRKLSVEQILNGDPGPPDFGAIVDGHFLSAPLSIIFAQGKQANVPYLVGSTSNEASVFGLMGFDAKTLHDRFGINFDEVKKTYNPDNKMSEFELLRQVQTDFIFTSAALGMAGLAAKKAPAYSYYFDYLPPSLRNTHLGADHCDDMPYLFGPSPDNSPQSLAIATQMQDYLYNFMVSGNPNSSNLPNWPETKTGAISPLLIQETSKAAPNFRDSLIRLWWDKWKKDTSQSVIP